MLLDYTACAHVKILPIPFKRLSTLYFPILIRSQKLSANSQLTARSLSHATPLLEVHTYKKTDGRGSICSICSICSHRKRPLPNL